MIGSLAGVLLGALPGFHPNLLIPFGKEWLFEVVFASIFSSIIPATLLIPSPELSALLLPGQEAAKRGELQRAIEEFSGGALLGTAIYAVTRWAYGLVPAGALRAATLPFLILTAALLLGRSKNRPLALLFFLLSGAYGAFILGKWEDPLGVHFASMFGLAGLYSAAPIPKQRVGRPRVVMSFPEAFAGTMGGLLISLFPAITPAQAYVVLVSFFGAARGLAAAGAMASSSFLFSFESYARFGKGRMATVEAIRAAPPDFMVQAVAAYATTLLLARYVAAAINRIPDVRRLSFAAIIIVMVAAYRDALPLAVPSFLLGLAPYYLGFERVHLMGSLLVPTMAWYLSNG